MLRGKKYSIKFPSIKNHFWISECSENYRNFYEISRTCRANNIPLTTWIVTQPKLTWLSPNASPQIYPKLLFILFFRDLLPIISPRWHADIWICDDIEMTEYQANLQASLDRLSVRVEAIIKTVRMQGTEKWTKKRERERESERRERTAKTNGVVVYVGADRYAVASWKEERRKQTWRTRKNEGM